MTVKSKVYLVRIGKDVEEKNYEIQEGLTKIGRNNTQHIRCNSLQVSREHCVVELVGGHVLLRDMQSFNGTYVMSTKIPALRTYVLNEGDLIGLGVEPPNADYVFKLVIENNAFHQDGDPLFNKEVETVSNSLKRKSLENGSSDPIPKRTKENSINSTNRANDIIVLGSDSPLPLKISSIKSLVEPIENTSENASRKTNNEVINISLDSDDSDNEGMITNREVKENNVDMKIDISKETVSSTVNDCKTVAPIPSTPASPSNPFEEHPSFSVNKEDGNARFIKEMEVMSNSLEKISVDNGTSDLIPKRTKDSINSTVRVDDNIIVLESDSPAPLKISSVKSLVNPIINASENAMRKTGTNNEIISINLDSDESDNEGMITNGKVNQNENDVDMKDVSSAVDDCKAVDPIPSTPASPDNPFEEHPSFSINDEVILLSDSDDDADFSSSQLFTHNSHKSETSLLFGNTSGNTVNIKNEITENYEACLNVYDDEDGVIEESHSGMFEEHFIHCSQEISTSESKPLSIDETIKDNENDDEEDLIQNVDDTSSDAVEEEQIEKNIYLSSEKELDVKLKDESTVSAVKTKELIKDKTITEEEEKEPKDSKKIVFNLDKIIKSQEIKKIPDVVLEKSQEKTSLTEDVEKLEVKMSLTKDVIEKSEEKKSLTEDVIEKSEEKKSLTADVIEKSEKKTSLTKDVKTKKVKEKKADIKVSSECGSSVSSKKISKSFEKKLTLDSKTVQKKSKLISPIVYKSEIPPEKPVKRSTRKRTSDKEKPNKVTRRSDVEKIKKERREKLKQIALKSKSKGELEKLISEDKTVELKSKESSDSNEKPIDDTIKVSDRAKSNVLVEDINLKRVVRVKLIDTNVKQNKEKLNKSKQLNKSKRDDKVKENKIDELEDRTKFDKDRMKKLREWEMNIINNCNSTLDTSKSFEVNEKNRRRVRFKEDLVEIKSYECEGHLTRKVSGKENRYRRDIPPPAPVIQCNWALINKTSYVLYDICKWNVSWLEESKTVKGDPPVVSYPCFSVKDSYINYRDYWKTMYPLLMTELWTEICYDLNNQKGGFKPQRCFVGVVRSVTKNQPCILYDNSTNGCCLISLDCVFVGSKDDCRRGIAPDEGDIGVVQVIIPKSDNSNDKIKIFYSFSFVTSNMKTVPFHRCQDHFAKYASVQAQKHYSNAIQAPPDALPGAPCIDSAQAFDKNDFNTCIYLQLSMCHSSHKLVIQGATVKLFVFKNLIKSLRTFHSLNRLKHSPLLNLVLNPKTIFKPKSNKELKHGIVSEFPLNQNQIDIVLEVSKNLVSGKPSISLIHGPPGSGKTRVISSIVLQLLAQNADKSKINVRGKILLCAPSNAAADSLALRLLDIRQSLPSEKRFKLIRVGATEVIHRHVRHISSQSLAEKEVGNSLDSENLKVDLRLLEAEETSLSYAIDCSKDETSRNRFTAELAALQERKRNLECLMIDSNVSGHQASYAHIKLVREAETKIIQGAEIIVTTLNSCCARKITDALGEYNHLRFSYCIVDEATQGIEQEVLLPLLHNISSLVLVGDPLQLAPTVLSLTCKKNKLDRSIFHRIWREWTNNGNMDDRPFYSLSVQHRMHPEISLFPSEHFYGGKLITPDFLNVYFPFEPYTVFSHSFSEDSDGESNSKESLLVVTLLSELIKAPEFKGLSIGVIVPYNLQKLIIEKDLKQMKIDLKYFKVNTIDSYQGQEKDVIIFSCVRSDGIGFMSDRLRLNVALTRARKCLILVANFKSFQEDYSWKALIDDAKKRGKLNEIPLTDNMASLQLIKHLRVRDKRKKSTSSSSNK